MNDGRDPTELGERLLAARAESPELPFSAIVTSSLVEWVQWQGSRYHVRLSTGGVLLCGTSSPLAETAAANSFPPAAKCCGLCRRALQRIGELP